MGTSTFVALALNFALLSLVAVGGVDPVLPEVYRQAVDVHHWTTAAQFRDLFALARVSPGPNMLIVSLIGWQAAGPAGAVVATLAMIVPCGTLTYFASRVWHGFRGAPWRRAIEIGLAPLTVGLILASGWLLARSGQPGPVSYAVSGVAAVVLWRTRLHPLWLLGAGGLLGLFGLM
ncbi:MAG: chromate transporter [Candidatus Rokubacteria bacterium]|nr:chromate transporter [Candidatus Rokubacteria bacterium]